MSPRVGEFWKPSDGADTRGLDRSGAQETTAADMLVRREPRLFAVCFKIPDKLNVDPSELGCTPSRLVIDVARRSGAWTDVNPGYTYPSPAEIDWSAG